MPTSWPYGRPCPPGLRLSNTRRREGFGSLITQSIWPLWRFSLFQARPTFADILSRPKHMLEEYHTKTCLPAMKLQDLSGHCATMTSKGE